MDIEKHSGCDFDRDESLKAYFYNTPSCPPGRRNPEESDASVSHNQVKIGNTLLFGGEYFGEVKQVGNSVDKIRAVCQIRNCKKTLSGSVRVTSNYTKHLKNVHPEKYAEYKTRKHVSTNRHGNLGTSRQDAFDEKLIAFITAAALPLSLVERPEFISLFEGTGLRVKSRTAMTRLLNARYDAILEKIKCVITTNAYFCTTVDIWSGRHRSFLGYTCHWIDEKFQRHSVALACKRFSTPHSAEHIADFISDINATFSLDHHNVVATVTDNGSNFVKAFREFGIENHINTENIDDVNDGDIEFSVIPSTRGILPVQLRCASHTLNLLATTDFIKIIKKLEIHQRHKRVFQKCNELWKKTSWPKSSEIIIQTLKASLLVPSVTRWNSLHNSVRRILDHKDKMEELCTKLSVEKFSLNDMSYLEEYDAVMEPIAATLNYLQQEKRMFYGYLIPALVTLKNKLHKLHSSGLELLKDVTIELERALVERFTPFFYLKPEVEEAIAAAVLLPSIKLKWFKGLNDLQHGRSIEDVSTSLIHRCINKEPGLRQTIADRQLEDHSPKDDFLDFDFYGESSQSQPNSQSTTSDVCVSNIEKEFTNYMSDTNSELDMLSKYPTLKKLFLRFNTPLTSSAPVERLFSFAGLIDIPRRNNLNDDTFERLVLLKANCNSIKSLQSENA